MNISVDNMTQQAEALLNAGKALEALAVYRDICVSDRGNANARLMVGAISAEIGRLDEAEHMLREAIALDAALAEAHFVLASILNAKNNFTAAIEHCKQATLHDPEMAEAWTLLCRLSGLLGDTSGAVTACTQAVTLAPGVAETCRSLGLALLTSKRPQEAVIELKRAVDLDAASALNWQWYAFAQHRIGDFAGAGKSVQKAMSLGLTDAMGLNLLAETQYESGNLDASMTSCDRCLAIDPNYAPALVNKANVYRSRGQFDVAMESLRRALEIMPDSAGAWHNLGVTQKERGMLHEAAESLRRALALDPNIPGTAHILASLGDTTPERAEEGYIVSLFDDYASRYDEHLSTLEYGVPEAIAKAIQQIRGDQARDLDILDLGCGTGLSGVALRQYAKRLTGVDLSPQMIARARDRAVYDDLATGDQVRYMSERPASYDLIVAADVFIYIGSLAPEFAAGRTALRDRGLLAFSTEASDDTGRDFALAETGRYTHDRSYVLRTAADHGLRAVLEVNIISRKEKGKPVHGRIFVFEKTGTM